MEDIQERELWKALEKIQFSATPLEGRGAIVIGNTGHRYLSGVPYLWTSFGERAFVFANAAQAQEIIDTFALPAYVYERKE